METGKRLYNESFIEDGRAYEFYMNILKNSSGHEVIGLSPNINSYINDFLDGKISVKEAASLIDAKAKMMVGE